MMLLLSFIKQKKISSFRTLSLNVTRFSENSTKHYQIQIPPNDTIFYVDAWRSHWCPYYNDRAFFLVPRINEFEHIVRSRGFKILHLNWKGDESNQDSKLRKQGRDLASKGMTESIQNTYPDNNAEVSNYIPGFIDSCIYPNFTRFGTTRITRPHYDLSLSKYDYVAQNFKNVAAEVRYLKFQNIIMLGMHTNLCIYNVAALVSTTNISIGFVDGLLDAGYYYPGQKKKINTHSKQNAACTRFISKKFGWTVNVYDLIRELKNMDPITSEPPWILYPEKAHFFHRLYKL